jgi:asparagine synthase (glutamine-hydrolysing)
MGRAGAFFPEAAGELRERFAGQLSSFEREAPFGLGVHWHSGQEVAVRTLSLVFAYEAFGRPAALEGFLFRALCRAGLYIEWHIEYAREAVFNNHLIWEALGLYMAGRLLKGVPEASRWEYAGRQILDDQANQQVYSDGGYIQQSHTYHRMAIQGYLAASRFLGAVPAAWRPALERSLEFLTAQQCPTSGKLPNFGPNDGTLPCLLSTCDYTDFRPTLQALSLLVRGERQYPPGPWDEEVAWLAGTDVLEAPLRRTVLASRSFLQSGQHVLRGKSSDSFGVFRCGSLRDRFGQIDMLHLDVWWRGHNVLADAGSYLYNGPEEWHNHFVRTEAHNTVRVDGRDQMVHFRRFKNLYWTKARLVHFEDGPDVATAAGEHYGYQRYPGACIHHRSIIFAKDDLWIVIDRISGTGEHEVLLHWLGGDYPFSTDSSGAVLRLQTADGPFTVTAYDGQGNAITGDIVAGGDSPPRGWLSRYYGEKVPVPSFVLKRKSRLPVQIVSVLSAGVPSVHCRGLRWSVSSELSRVEFSLRGSGVLPEELSTCESVVRTGR